MRKTRQKKHYEMMDKLSKDQQIERLVRQRNALLKLLQNYTIESYFMDGELSNWLDDMMYDMDVKRKNGEIVVSIDTSKLHNFLIDLWETVQTLDKKADEIVGNLYASEGCNPATRDIDPRPDCDPVHLQPYLKAVEGEKPWR